MSPAAAKGVAAGLHTDVRMFHRLSKSALAKAVIGVSLALTLGLSAASGRQTAARPTDEEGGCPTHFDYVVLASLADSGNWMGLSTYRFERRIDWKFLPKTGVQHVLYSVDRARSGCGLHRQQTGQQSG
jgi:hypothetical protein